MDGGNSQSKQTAFRAYSLLEDYSALTEKWPAERQQALLALRKAIVEELRGAHQEDTEVINCCDHVGGEGMRMKDEGDEEGG